MHKIDFMETGFLNLVWRNEHSADVTDGLHEIYVILCWSKSNVHHRPAGIITTWTVLDGIS